MPKIHFSEPVQITIIVAAAIVFLFVLAWYIRRALRPKPDIPVDVGPPVIDPNAPTPDQATNETPSDTDLMQDQVATSTSSRVHFSALYPRVVPVETKRTLVVYAHLPEEYLDFRTEVPPSVREDAMKFQGEMGNVKPHEVTTAATRPVSHGTFLTIVPDCDGIEFNPPNMRLRWGGKQDRAVFSFQADRRLTGTAVNGEIDIYVEALNVATLKLVFVCDETGTDTPDNEQKITVPMYERIFASYSHADTPVVEACRKAYTALGMEVLIDYESLHSGAVFMDELERLIKKADVFQLFWSERSAESEFVRHEWKYALSLNKARGFIRPVHWKRPLADVPPELSNIHFKFVPLPGEDGYDPTTPASPPSPPSPPTDTPVVSAVSERAEPTTATPALPETTEAQVGHDGDTELVKVWPHQLAQITVVAAAMDNQWEPRNMLAKMRRNFTRQPQGLADISSARRHLGKAEYIRALLNSQQLAVNRVFLYNTDYIAEDYVRPGETRDAFIKLLDNGVIVPFLIEEHSPSETPKSVQTVTQAFEEWQRVCSEARVHAVRLDWDDEANQEANRILRGRFAMWLHDLGVIDRFGDIKALAKSVGVTEEQIPDFRRRLLDVTHWVQEQEDTVYRGNFYGKFIVVPGTDVIKGIVDFDQNRNPFAAELKQLADLSYATNLPDALGRYALTPMDSLPRTALQELNIRFGQQGGALTGSDINTLLQREAFDLISGMEALSSMEHLSLRDVIELRATDEWGLYIREMQGLLDQPLEFGHRSKLVYDRYTALARLMTDRVKASGKTDALERWSPVVKLILTVGTSSLSIWSPFDTSMAGKILYNVTDGAIGQVANLTARMIIGGIADRRAEAELETSLDFMRGKLDGARDAWADVLGKLASDPRFVNVSDQVDHSQDEFDPNINFQEDIPTIAN